MDILNRASVLMHINSYQSLKFAIIAISHLVVSHISILKSIGFGVWQ